MPNNLMPLNCGELESVSTAAPLCNLLNCVYELMLYIKSNSTEAERNTAGLNPDVDAAFQNIKTLCVEIAKRMDNGESKHCITCVEKSTPKWVTNTIIKLTQSWTEKQRSTLAESSS